MNRKFSLKLLFILVFGLGAIVTFMFAPQNHNIAFAQPKGVQVETLEEELRLLSNGVSKESKDEETNDVQAVLSGNKTAVISGAIDGVLRRLPFKSGDLFKKGDVLAAYNCDFEQARLKEIRAQLRVTSRQKAAFERLKEQDAVADVEYVSIVQEHEQIKAVLEQIQSRLNLCVIKAPFDGRVTEKVANNHEAVRSGRVLMEITSIDPLQAELLVPSVWLRWLNVGTSLDIAVHETGQSYGAKIKRLHGKVDPVTQTIHVVAELNQYEEKLLPGMSGRAIFKNSEKDQSEGFLGLKIQNGR